VNAYIIPKHYPEIAASIGLEIDSPEAAVPHYLKMEILPDTVVPGKDGLIGTRVQAQIDYKPLT
jgi:hypothetical protein